MPDWNSLDSRKGAERYWWWLVWMSDGTVTPIRRHRWYWVAVAHYSIRRLGRPLAAYQLYGFFDVMSRPGWR